MPDTDTSPSTTLLSPTGWIKLVIVVSLVLAVASGTVLYRRMHLWRPDAAQQQATPQDDSSVFVAPVGILDPDAEFAPVDSFSDAPPPAPPRLPDPVAPENILDPAWKPPFSGVTFPAS